MAHRILVIDDDASMCELLELELQRHDFDAVSATAPSDALSLFDQQDFDAVLTDVRMSGANGVELCEQIVARREDVPVIVATAYADTETAIAAIRAGAYDFVTKPFDMDELALTLERAIRHRALREEVKRLRKAVDDAARFDEILGGSAAIKTLCNLVARAAESDATVLVTGESGTGKELVARALHTQGARKSGPFVAVNCAAMPEALLESELFGHVRGAFTDARAARQGLFVRANGGTLLLDEIGEMPAGMQAKLLRVLQERTVRPVGGDAEQPVNVRIVAATNRDLETEVEQRRFREDLFYRINVVRIHVPPLRARGSDVLLLARSFLERYAAQSRRAVVGMTSAAVDKVLSYPWPGNVRELQNCIERAVALAPLDHVGVNDLPDTVRDYRATRVDVDSTDPAELPPMEEIERRYIAEGSHRSGRQQDPGGPGARLRPEDALPKAGTRPGPAGEPQRTASGERLRAVSPEDVTRQSRVPLM